MEKRPFSSVPKLFPHACNPFKRPSVPTESLFDSDYCSYSALNTRIFTQSSKSPNKTNNKDSNLRNLKLKLLNFLKSKKNNEFQSESSLEKKGKNIGIVSLSTRIVSGNVKNFFETLKTDNFGNNEYLLGKKTRESSKSVRKRKKAENLKLESTNASSNFTNSKECVPKTAKQFPDPKEEIYRFFAKKNKQEEEKGKKLYRSANVYVNNEPKSDKTESRSHQKVSKDARNKINIEEIMSRIKNVLEFHAKRERLYRKKIAFLEQKVRDLEEKNRMKGGNFNP